jgi:hypothetical protein
MAMVVFLAVLRKIPRSYRSEVLPAWRYPAPFGTPHCSNYFMAGEPGAASGFHENFFGKAASDQAFRNLFLKAACGPEC